VAHAILLWFGQLLISFVKPGLSPPDDCHSISGEGFLTRDSGTKAGASTSLVRDVHLSFACLASLLVFPPVTMPVAPREELTHMMLPSQVPLVCCRMIRCCLLIELVNSITVICLDITLCIYETLVYTVQRVWGSVIARK
jgi:hypothetical protein